MCQPESKEENVTYLTYNGELLIVNMSDISTELLTSRAASCGLTNLVSFHSLGRHLRLKPVLPLPVCLAHDGSLCAERLHCSRSLVAHFTLWSRSAEPSGFTIRHLPAEMLSGAADGRYAHPLFIYVVALCLDVHCSSRI